MSQARQPISLACSRRDLWRPLLREALVVWDALRGHVSSRLFDLTALPDESLAGLRPIVNPQVEIFVDRDQVCGRFRSTGTTVSLFETTPENVTAFNLFNGRWTLAEIGDRLALEMGWDPAAGFEHAKRLFFVLVSHWAGFPSEPLPAE